MLWGWRTATRELAIPPTSPSSALACVDRDRFCVACMLGGPGCTALFLLTVEWRGAEKVDEAIAARVG